MRIAITGSSGMVGTALSAAFSRRGDEVIPVTRGGASGSVHWDPAHGTISASGLEGIDAVVHLAGENLASGRWTRDRKHQLWHSRTDGTDLLCETLARLARPPRVLVSASAVGYYGDRNDERLFEDSAPGSGYLARLCLAWEAAANPARAAAIRVVHPRFGIILARHGGALQKMVPPFRLGLGGRYGSGEQWMSWIALDDVVGGIRHLITTDTAIGPVNFVAPEPVRNRDFATALGTTLHRPAVLPVPAWTLRLALGEMADAALLASQRVSCDALLQIGYHFELPTLSQALDRAVS